MNNVLRIGTRDSQLAVWQATLVQLELAKHNIAAELVYIKSEGDIDLSTPLYEIGVQGIFTRTLDIALLGKKIDLAVHSMKDVPTQLPGGIVQGAVLPRASHSDLLVYNGDPEQILGRFNGSHAGKAMTIATSSIRRKAQWLHRFPSDRMENLRGNVNTRLKKLADGGWNGAIFAAAGLERIGLRPENAIELDWMLPAPAQGAIMVVCRAEDERAREGAALLNDIETAMCAKIERDFLRTLLGGCSTPISALAVVNKDRVRFRGNIFSVDGAEHADVDLTVPVADSANLGADAARSLLEGGGKKIAEAIHNAG